MVEVRLKKGDQSRLSVSTDGLTSLLAAVRLPAEPGLRPGDGYPTVRYARKQLLFAAGNLPTMLYFIRRGQLKCFSADTSGNEFITSLRSEGDFLGYEALLRESAYDESAEVLVDTDVCAIPKAEFFDLMAQNPDVATYFMRLLATDIADRNDRLLRLAYQSVRRRVADALLLVQRKFYAPVQPNGDAEPLPAGEVGQDSPAAEPPPLPMSLSRENWSHLVGASTETVIRTLSDLRAEGLIELTGSQITIVNLERLIRLKH